ncbi:MAG: glycerophosphodiester phosphodiesterase [Actinomycetes bacterium]
MHRFEVEIVHLLVSPGHAYFGRSKDGPEDVETTDADSVEVVARKGIVGDRFFGKAAHLDAAVTLDAAEALEAVARELGAAPFDPLLARRNVDVLAAEPGYLDAALAGDRLVVQSFDHESMKRFDAVDDSIPVGLLTGTRMTTAQLEAAATFAEQVNPSFRVADQAFVDEVQSLGMEMNVYTVNTGRDAIAMIDRGVDGIISDYPLTVMDILKRG